MTSEAWSRLSSLRVFFGHQSVGRNIMQGAQELAASERRDLSVRAWAPGGDLSSPGILHANVGVNGDPGSKLGEFDRLLGQLGDRVDVALVKFCYVDITPATDVNRLFAEYTALVRSIHERRPHTVLVHVTVPLEAVPQPTGIAGRAKHAVKALLGRADDSTRRNRLREAYSDLLRREYGGREPVFDLADVEATAPDGEAVRSKLDGHEVRTLDPRYTTDGAHLNELGRRTVSARLLAFLAGVAR